MAVSDQQGNNHYIDNKRFYKEITIWINEIKYAKDNNLERPQLSEYLGECFLKIAENLSHRPNFIGYTFREDLVSDGYENCILYGDRFNPEKTKNAFSYFTTIIFRSFLRRIAKEKKVYSLKNKIIFESGVLDQFMSVDDKDNQLHIEQHIQYLRNFTKKDDVKDV